MSSVVISGDTSGAVTLAAPAVAGTTTLTLPATTGTVLNDATVGVCRAWVNFDGTLTGTITPRAAFNVSSVTKNGTGDYTINFTNAISDANYAAVWTVGPNTTGAGPQVMIPRMTNYSAASNAYQAQTTTAIRVSSSNTSATVTDTVIGTLAVFR